MPETTQGLFLSAQMTCQKTVVVTKVCIYRRTERMSWQKARSAWSYRVPVLGQGRPPVLGQGRPGTMCGGGEHQAGSGTGCCALQRMTGCASVRASTVQRTPRWHQRAVNSSRLSVGSRPRSQSLRSPVNSRMLAVASRQSARRAFLQEHKMRAASCPGDVWAADDGRAGRRPRAGR